MGPKLNSKNECSAPLGTLLYPPRNGLPDKFGQREWARKRTPDRHGVRTKALLGYG